jgi:hypothetical protein
MVMKKTVLILLAAVMLCLCACQGEEPATPQVYTLSPADLQTSVVAVSPGDPQIATAELTEAGDVKITSCGAGTTVLTAMTNYGESFEITVRCDDRLNITASSGYTAPVNQAVVTDFGAMPDDDYDDTAAIQQAIDSLENGGTVYVPKGVYVISQLVLRENVALRLEGAVAAPTLGYEASGAAAKLQNGEYAVLRTNSTKAMFLNHNNRDYGRNGCSNVTVSGGVMDMQGRRCCFIFSCAENVVLENILFLNGPNDHAIQLGGCKIVSIRGCIFAGYNYRSNNTGAESIQIEQTHPGAMGAVGHTASIFETGEHYFCEDVRIADCWFGASETYDSPTYAIGHHGQSYKSGVTGLQITGCVFDNCRCSAISYPAFSDVRIAGNTFLNDRDNCVSNKDKPYQLNLSLNNNDAGMLVADEDGNVVNAFFARKYACQGSLRTVIEDNRFILGAACGKYGAVSAVGLAQNYNVVYEPEIRMLRDYKEPYFLYRGHVATRNIIEDLTLRNNCVQVDADIESEGYFFNFSYVEGLTIENNRVEGKEFDAGFKMNGVTYPNCRIVRCTTSEDHHSSLILQAPRKGEPGNCTVSAGGQSIRLASQEMPTVAIMVKAQGGTVGYTIAEDGSIQVTLTPDEGKAFKEIQLPSFATQDSDGVYLLQYSAEIIVVFE